MNWYPEVLDVWIGPKGTLYVIHTTTSLRGQRLVSVDGIVKEPPFQPETPVDLGRLDME